VLNEKKKFKTKSCEQQERTYSRGTKLMSTYITHENYHHYTSS